MKILVVADPHISVPPVKYGGTERIVALLCEELVCAGHSVRLLAGAGSQDYGHGLVVHQAPTLGRSSRACRKLLFQWLLWRAARGVDVVINFGRLDYLHVVYRMGKPLVNWFQNPVRQGELDYVAKYRQRKYCSVFVSYHQRQHLRLIGCHRVIHNVVDTNFLMPLPTLIAGSYAVFLGRLTRNKGVHLAIQAARSAKIHLIIAGNVSRELGGQEYFEQMVKPELGKGCEWVGEVDDEQKRRLLQRAKCFLFPIMWDEPCAVSVIESLACGTPVIAHNRASVPEIIRHGQNGLLCDGVESMAIAIGLIDSISRQNVRESAITKFSPSFLLSQTLEAIKQAGQ